jgi:hypothetical protein
MKTFIALFFLSISSLVCQEISPIDRYKSVEFIIMRKINDFNKTYELDTLEIDDKLKPFTYQLAIEFAKNPINFDDANEEEFQKRGQRFMNFCEKNRIKTVKDGEKFYYSEKVVEISTNPYIFMSNYDMLYRSVKEDVVIQLKNGAIKGNCSIIKYNDKFYYYEMVILRVL